MNEEVGLLGTWIRSKKQILIFFFDCALRRFEFLEKENSSCKSIISNGPNLDMNPDELLAPRVQTTSLADVRKSNAIDYIKNYVRYYNINGHTDLFSTQGVHHFTRRTIQNTFFTGFMFSQ